MEVVPEIRPSHFEMRRFYACHVRLLGGPLHRASLHGWTGQLLGSERVVLEAPQVPLWLNLWREFGRCQCTRNLCEFDVLQGWNLDVDVLHFAVI